MDEHRQFVNLGGMRQSIEFVYDTIKNHSPRTTTAATPPAGPYVRIARRLLGQQVVMESRPC
jgi:hypothetical protein